MSTTTKATETQWVVCIRENGETFRSAPIRDRAEALESARLAAPAWLEEQEVYPI
jgi:hypothetical protein